MGICRLFFSIASYLRKNPEQLTQATLESLAAQYRPYAYVGARKQPHEFVLQEAQEMGIDPAERFGTDEWQKDSGAFPDFVLACEAHNPHGNGALLELKDSAGERVASFNSTLPSAQKQVSHLTKMVQTAVQFYESKRGCHCPDKRDCFYLVRTKRKNSAECRVSVIQGTFFETIPNRELLRLLWKHLFEQAGVSTEQYQTILNSLAALERDEVAESRVIEGAAVKPRLRIMSEVVAKANPHKYTEIGERTVNPILKAPSEDNSDAHEHCIVNCLTTDNLSTRVEPNGTPIVSGGSDYEIACRVVRIEHKLNGLHLVIQVQLDEEFA
jgi:hypothetical protein